MGCGCNKRRKPKPASVTKDGVMGGYKYLTDRQIRARLEVYKKNYCKKCEKRYKCDFVMYTACKKSDGND